MRPDVDESDADGPQDARIAEFGVPEDARQPAESRSLEELFGPRMPTAESDEAAAAATRAKLAEFFARQPPAAPVSPPPADEMADVARPAAIVTEAWRPQKTASPGTFGVAAPSTARRGVRGALFGSWWRSVISVGASFVLIAAIVAGAVIGTQIVADNARLSAAQRTLDAAESAVGTPTAELESSQAQYDQAVAAARAAADEAAPALAAVTGMADPVALDEANAALAALTTGLEQGSPSPAPAPYEPAKVDRTDIHRVTAAAKRARDYAAAVSEAQAGVDAARTDLVTRTLALAAAEKALGSGLPAVAEVATSDNPLAEQSFRDAVTAAAAAVIAAQAAGGSGNPELLNYAAAVAALRVDQARAVAEKKNSTPPSTRPRTSSPTPSPTPTPVPDPTPPTEPPPVTP